MSNPVYKCLHCDYSSTTQYVIGHFLSHHPDQIDDFSLKTGAKGFPVSIDVKVVVDGDIATKKEVFCCFGAKKFWARRSLADTHFGKGEENKKAHIAVCVKELERRAAGLPLSAVPSKSSVKVVEKVVEKVAVPVAQPVVVVADNSELLAKLAKLEAENMALKKQVKNLQSDVEALEETAKENNELVDCCAVLKTVVGRVLQTPENIVDGNALFRNLYKIKPDTDWDSYFD